jgi:hypothetical protein
MGRRLGKLHVCVPEEVSTVNEYRSQVLDIFGWGLCAGGSSVGQAIFQCLQGLPEGGLRRIILTASGGAFRDWPVEKLKEVTAADAVKHPNWRFAPGDVLRFR